MHSEDARPVAVGAASGDRKWDANDKLTFDTVLANLQGALSGAKDADTLVRLLVFQAAQNALNVGNQVAHNAAQVSHFAALRYLTNSDLSLDKIMNLEPSEAAAQSAVLPIGALESLYTLMVKAVADGIAQGKAKE